MTIIEFLEARLAEDEALVSKALEPEWSGERPTFYSKGTEGAHRDDWGLWTFHITPDRFLAEIAAKRALLEWVPEDVKYPFASVYSDHPDFQKEWAQ